MTWLTIMEYLCHKWPRICSTCRKHFPVLSSFTTYYRCVTRLTRRVPLVEQELLTLPEHLSSPPVFSGVRVTRSLVLYVCFVDRCLSFCTFSFGHCVVCSSSIYGFWLPLWYLQTLLVICVTGRYNQQSIKLLCFNLMQNKLLFLLIYLHWWCNIIFVKNKNILINKIIYHTYYI
jgi:hypothetical protein